MRAIFAVLVVANVLLLALQWVAGGDDPEPEERGPRSSVASSTDLLLLSEAERELPARNESSRSPVELATPTLGEGSLCTMIGPFSEPKDAFTMVQRMQALDVVAEVQEVEVSSGTGYWVYLSPELSQREALSRLHELQAKDIDSYVIPRGELANGISFGMFSRPELAEARRSELESRGYDAKIREIERTHRETWVSMPASQARSLAESLWEEVLDEFSELERRQNLCPGVASE